MEQLKWLLDAWVRELGQVLEMMTGQPARVDWSPAGPDHTAFSGIDLWWRQSFSIAPKAFAWLGARPHAWSEIGRKALEAAGVDAADPAELRNTFQEILQQSLSALAGAITAELGRQTDCADGGIAESAGAAAARATAQVTGEGFSATIAIVMSDEFVRALNRAPAAPPIPESQAVPVAAPRNMEFLLDVEVPVSLSFGQARLPLKDVLKLTPGSVVELNRQPDEPVDIIVNNSVIARGEVVVVEGNYGVRIQKIISRQQRLALRSGGGIA
jgi:flagellar motor switch protein FliN/FliY